MSLQNRRILDALQIKENKTGYHVNFRDWFMCNFGGARGVVVIVVGNGHGDTSSNPGPD